MSRVKKVRCAHCKKVNTINVDQELANHEQDALRMLTHDEIEKPKTIYVNCQHCGERFGINL